MSASIHPGLPCSTELARNLVDQGKEKGTLYGCSSFIHMAQCIPAELVMRRMSLRTRYYSSSPHFQHHRLTPPSLNVLVTPSFLFFPHCAVLPPLHTGLRDCEGPVCAPSAHWHPQVAAQPLAQVPSLWKAGGAMGQACLLLTLAIAPFCAFFCVSIVLCRAFLSFEDN